MTKNPENKQYQILHYIWEKVNEKGYPPTVREIGEAVNLSSTSTVHGHISRLERKGISSRTLQSPEHLR